MTGWIKKPVLIEDEYTVTLKFSPYCIQSRMVKGVPTVLALGYTQVMMAFLLIEPAPRDILIVGLGGGSLSKYCHEHLPASNITTLEISEEVIAMRDAFCIPADDERFKVIHCDAAEYLKAATAIADVILVDGYNESGIPTELGTESFYRDCYRALKRDGLVLSNLAGETAVIRRITGKINKVFSRRTFRMESSSGSNEIVCGVKRERLPEGVVMKARAIALRSETGMNFPRFLDQIVANSRHWKSGRD